MRIIEKLEEGGIYHIYNRGINGENLFKGQNDYFDFINKYDKYCSQVLETYAYSLLKNHFHFLVKVKENCFEPKKDGKGLFKLNASKQLSHFFNSYAQSINFKHSRHGKLFEEPFRRKLVKNDIYFTSLIYYIHFNPQQHKFVRDFREWEFTSYNSILTDETSFLAKHQVLDWFGGRDQFIKAHCLGLEINELSNLMMD